LLNKKLSPTTSFIIFTIFVIAAIVLTLWLFSVPTMGDDFSKYLTLKPDEAGSLNNYIDKKVAVRGISILLDPKKLKKIGYHQDIIAFIKARTVYSGRKRRTEYIAGESNDFYIENGKNKFLISGTPKQIFDYKSNIDGNEKSTYYMTVRNGREYSVFGTVKSGGGKTFIEPFRVTDIPIDKLKNKATKNKTTFNYIKYIVVGLFILVYVAGIFGYGRRKGQGLS